MNIWVPLTGDESVICLKKQGDKYDLHAVAVTRNKVVVGCILKKICDHFWKFLSLPKASICAWVLGKGFNCGAGYCLEIPYAFFFKTMTKG